MSDLMTILDTTMTDALPKVYRDAGPLFFPIGEMADRTMENVAMTPGDPNDLSRRYQVKHGWKIGSAGMIRSISPYGSPALDVGTEARVMDALGSDADMAPFPRASESPLPGDFVRTLYLAACAGNLPIPMHYMFSDSLNAQTLKQIVRILKTAGENTKRMDAQSYFAYRATNDAGYKTTVLARVASAAKATHSLRAGSYNDNFVDIVIDGKYGTIANFYEGQEIDIVTGASGSATEAGTLKAGVATDGTDILNYDASAVYVQVIVVKIDRLTNTLSLIGIARNSAESSAAADAIAAFDNTHGWKAAGSKPISAYSWIVPRGASRYIAGTRPWLTHGVFDWIANSGYIMGGSQYAQGLDLAEYPMFKSLLYTATGPLTEFILDRLSIEAAQSFPNVNITDWITTAGVLLKFKEELVQASTSRFDRTNLPVQVKGGWTLANYVTPQGSYRWWTSPYMHSGKMIGQQIDKANLKLYTNKVIGDTQAGFAEDVQFVGKLLGYPTSRVPETAANGTPKTISGMPWIRFCLLCPIMPNGWLLDGLTEADTKNLTV